MDTAESSYFSQPHNNVAIYGRDGYFYMSYSCIGRWPKICLPFHKPGRPCPCLIYPEGASIWYSHVLQGQDLGCCAMAALKKKGSYGCNERGNRWGTHDLPCPGLLVMRLAWLNSMDCSHSRHSGETINDILIGHHDSDGTKSPAVGNEASLALNYSAKPCEFVLGHRASRRRWTVSARAASAIACLVRSSSADLAYRFR